MKKFRTVLFCLLLMVVIFCSCSRSAGSQPEQPTADDITQEAVTTADGEQKKKNKSVVLGYYSHYSLNPFTTESKTNKNILTLVYDSLFKLDDAYNAVPVVAEAYEQNGKTLTVTLKNDLTFSTGASLSSADVIYSFNQSKKSPLYAERLSRFQAAAASGTYGVIFTLTSADIYAVNCLDFPIVRAGTAGDSLPPGSGRYTISKSGKSYVLKANQEYNLTEEMEQQQIRLFDINTTENELYLLQIGDLSFVYDDMSSDKERMRINANTVPIALNNLVFLGINNESEILSDMNVRNAIAAAIDKTAVAGSVYDLLAKPCATPFNPDWSVVNLSSGENLSPDTIQAAELLEKSGYIFAYSNNKFRSKNFEFLELNLIVPSDDSRRVECAKLIEHQLESVGISIKTEKIEYDDYKARLNSGDFDLYIGETKLKPNMDLSVFFSQSGAANFTLDSKSTVANAYSDFISGKIDISTFVQVFNEYKPFLPICYRYGTAYYSREIQYEGNGNENNMFANIYSWSI